MARRDNDTRELDLRQRMTLFSGTGVPADVIVSTPSSELTFSLFIAKGVRAVNFCAAGIRPLAFKEFGIENASQMKQLGFDALHLVDPIFVEQACAAYGAEDLLRTFLVDASDAVAISGTEASDLLQVTMQQLLELCVGLPVEASAVLSQCKSKTPLDGVFGTTLLDTGLRKAQLLTLGIDADTVRALNFSKPSDFNKFGF